MNVQDMKGWTVRPLISYTSWVKYVVRQYGFYLLEIIRVKEKYDIVRKELLSILTYGLPVVHMFNINIILYK
jgi:hypothetical protein